MLQKSGYDSSPRLGPVHLNVEHLIDMAAFYSAALALRTQRRGEGELALGLGGEDLLVLHEADNPRPAGPHAGLYHFCLAVERREDLGWWLNNLVDGGFEIQGMVDHRMAEAIYIQDPEGNSIELNWDRPRSEWRPWSEWLSMGNGPLDTRGLLEVNAKAGPRKSPPSDTRVGHIHLHVGDLEASKKFYIGKLGLDVMAEIPGQAVFTSYGGYHHHVAFNLWRGRGIPAALEGAPGLRHFTFMGGDNAGEHSDPSGNRVIFQANGVIL